MSVTPLARQGLAERIGVDQDVLNIIRSQIAPEAPDEIIILHVMRCRQFGVDPTGRFLYPVKRQGRWQLQSSIDLFRAVAESSDEYAGQTAPEWCAQDGKWVDVWLSKQPPVAARIGVHRAGFKEPLYAIALWDEYKPAEDFMWKKMPSLMLSKCAEALALRKAFPKKLSGLYTNDEMAQAEKAARKPAAPALPPPGKERDTLAETILRAAALGCIEDATREALTAWAAEHGLLVQGRLTPSALGKIVAALDAAEDVRPTDTTTARHSLPQGDETESGGSSPGLGASRDAQTPPAQPDEQPQVFEPSADAVERQAKALRQRMHVLAHDLHIDDARRKSMMRRRYPAIFADVKHGEESSTMLPLPMLEAFVRDLEDLARAYEAKKSAQK